MGPGPGCACGGGSCRGIRLGGATPLGATSPSGLDTMPRMTCGSGAAWRWGELDCVVQQLACS